MSEERVFTAAPGDTIVLNAAAKINLGLDVTGVREDGYHLLRMVMQSLKLHDRLLVRTKHAAGIRVKTNRSYLPEDEHNLAGRAVRLLMDEFKIRDGLYVDIEKHIPSSAGLAGGSSDAAAALIGVNELFGLGLSRAELQERAVRIGADVPYCIMGGTALAEGIGEKLTPLPALPECSIVLVKPPVRVSTKAVYQELDMARLGGHPRIDDQIDAIRSGNLEKTASLCGNVLESVTVPMHPVIDAIKKKMMECGALNAMMSGSGPTVFGIFRDTAQARAAADVMQKERFGQVIVTAPSLSPQS